MPLLCCDVALVSELRLTAGCVLMDLASPAVSGTSVYANGLTGAQDSHLQTVTIPEAAYIYNYDVDLLKMSRVCSKHVEDFN